MLYDPRFKAPFGKLSSRLSEANDGSSENQDQQECGRATHRYCNWDLRESKVKEAFVPGAWTGDNGCPEEKDVTLPGWSDDRHSPPERRTHFSPRSLASGCGHSGMEWCSRGRTQIAAITILQHDSAPLPSFTSSDGGTSLYLVVR